LALRSKVAAMATSLLAMRVTSCRSGSGRAITCATAGAGPGRAVSRSGAAGRACGFESLFNPGRALAFPCDERGQVELDTLSERARHNYLYARAVVGREYATPAVVRDHG
jgi:hypothetical protein